MKKFLLLVLTVIPVVLFLASCNTPTTIKEALKQRNIEIEKIYSMDNFNNILVVFYKDKKSEHQTVGLFSKEKNSIHFIIQQDIQSNLNSNEQLTTSAFMQDKTEKFSEFSFQFGVIKDPQIEDVNLHMNDNTDFQDRYAKVIEIDGLRVWYTFLDTKRIFNIQQGLSKDGKVIYSNGKY